MHEGGLLAPRSEARDPQAGTPSAKSPARPSGGPWSFCFPSSASQASVGLKAKIPSALRALGILLRSVADSNRRTRFCRPMPSHSANRPCFAVDAYPPAGGQTTDAAAKIINIWEFLFLPGQRRNTCHVTDDIHQVAAGGNDYLGI